MQEIVLQIRERLLELAEEKYRDFNHSLVPGEAAPMLGVRLPKLREIAKELAKEQGRDYMRAATRDIM